MNNFFIIATPIGNIDEITNRAIIILKSIKIIFCEDTRVTKKLFNKIGISIKNKKFIVCNNFSENKLAINILNFLNIGDCALLSDAGYPLINDPGFFLKNELYKNNITPIIINGPCSIIHALVMSDFPINNFYFSGFLSKKKEKRKKDLFYLKKINSTIVIFESVHNIIETLNDILYVFGDIEINILKELTKINEKKYFDKLSRVIQKIDLRGEFIIIFENKKNIELDFKKLFFEIDNLKKNGIKTKDACRMVSYKYELKNNFLYEEYENRKDN